MKDVAWSLLLMVGVAVLAIEAVDGFAWLRNHEACKPEKTANTEETQAAPVGS